jgi:hypothetical protein
VLSRAHVRRSCIDPDPAPGPITTKTPPRNQNHAPRIPPFRSESRQPRALVRARARERRAASAPTDQNPSRPGPARRAARRSSHRAVSRFGIQCAGARAARLVGALDGGRGRQPARRCRSRGWKHPSGRRGRHSHPHRQRQRLRLGTSGMRGFALTVYEAAAAAATVPETTCRPIRCGRRACLNSARP